MNSRQNKEHIKRAKEKAQENIRKGISLEAIFSGIGCVVGSFFVAIILSGTGFSKETFEDPKFYLSTAISFGIMMYAYNFAKTIFVRKLKKHKEGEYKKAEDQEARIQKYIHDWHHQDLIESAVIKETEFRRKAAAQYLLDQITYGLDIDKIEDIDNINNIATNEFAFKKFIEKRQLRRRKFFLFFWQKNEVKKLKKTLRKVLNGKYKYESVDIRDLISDISASPHLARKFKIDERKANLKENRKKAVTFVISTAIMNALIWKGLDPSFWSALLAQFLLIMSSISGAYTVAVSRVNDLTVVMQNRNEFNYAALQDELKKIPLGISPTAEVKPVQEKPKPIMLDVKNDNPLTNDIAIDQMTQLNDKINALSKS